MKQIVNDTRLYIYCGVRLANADQPYSYRTDDDTIKIGDLVVVPVGASYEEVIGVVVSVGRFAQAGVPYPLEKTKFIDRKATRDDLREFHGIEEGLYKLYRNLQSITGGNRIIDEEHEVEEGMTDGQFQMFLKMIEIILDKCETKEEALEAIRQIQAAEE